MAAYIGSHKIDKCYLGTQEIDKVMLGAHEVCSASAADKPLTGDAADFLVTLTEHHYFGAKPSGWNQTMESLPENGIFPTGQKMLFGMWNPGATEISQGAASGMNAGLAQNNYWHSEGSIANYVAGGLKVLGYIRDYAGNHSGGTAADYWSSSSSTTKEQLADRAKAEMDAYLADSNAGDHIHSFVYGLDDYTEHADETKMHYVFGKIAAHKHMPCGNLGSPMYKTSSYSRYMPEHTAMYEQTYIYGGVGCTTEDGDENSTQYWRIRSNAQFKMWSMYKHQIDLHYNSPTGKPRLLVTVPGPFVYRKYVSPPSLLNNSKAYIRICKHDILLALMSGANSYMCYQMRSSYALNCHNSLAHYEASRTGLFDFVKRLTESEADKALLWGKGSKPYTFNEHYASGNAHPITESRVSGDSSYSWTPASLYHSGMPTGYNSARDPAVEYMILYRDVKFKNKRFIFITNSNPSKEYADINLANMPSNQGKITSRFSGFPTDGTHMQLKAVNILTDTEYSINAGGYIDVETEACSAAVIMVSPADGYAGGDTPQPAPVITQHPQSLSLHAGDPVPTLTVGYTPSTASVQWEFKNTGAWQDIPGATSAKYTMHDSGSGVTIGQNGDNFRARVTTSGNAPVYSNTAIITVT